MSPFLLDYSVVDKRYTAQIALIVSPDTRAQKKVYFGFHVYSGEEEIRADPASLPGSLRKKLKTTARRVGAEYLAMPESSLRVELSEARMVVQG